MCGMRISFPKVLKSERPDVNEKRSNLLKLQGTTVIHNLLHCYYYYLLDEFLLCLEKSLLTASMRSKVVSFMTTCDRDSIYSNDDVISCVFLFLESSQTLKKEAIITDTVMGKVDTVSQQHLYTTLHLLLGNESSRWHVTVM